MFKQIRTLFQQNKLTSKSQTNFSGFVYVTDRDTGALRDISAGATVRNPNPEPPWIVVFHSLTAISVSQWPGRLFRVEVLERAREQPMAYADYTRAIAVVAVEELLTHSLFGEHGSQIAKILDRISTLSLDDAFALSAALQPSSQEIYSKAWQKWLTIKDKNSPYKNENHKDTLQVWVGEGVSPVGYALSLASYLVSKRGQAVSGQDATIVDAEGEIEMQQPWSGATNAFLHAVMAYGAPILLTSDEATALKFPFGVLEEANN